MKSKLKAFEAKIKGNSQESFTSSYGKQMFVFTVFFEDGTEGEANSTREQPHWKIGDEYTFEREVKTFDWGTITKIKGMKKLEEEGQYSKSSPSSRHQKSPDDQKRIQAQVALIATNSIMTKIQEDHDTIVREFLSWLILTGTGNNVITAQGCLKISSEYWREVPTQEVTIKSVIDTANEFLNKVNKSARWDGIINRETSQPSSKESEKSTEKPQSEVDPAYLSDQLDKPENQESDLAKKDEENESPFMKIL